MPVGLIISAFGCFEPVMKWEKILDLAAFETLNCQKMVRIGIAVKAATDKSPLYCYQNMRRPFGFFEDGTEVKKCPRFCNLLKKENYDINSTTTFL